MAAQHVPAVGNHVLISGGKKAGTVTSLITASQRDTISAFVVHYGWRKRKAKVVPIEDVKWVNTNSVILTLSSKQFDELADWTPSSPSTTTVVDNGVAGGTTVERQART